MRWDLANDKSALEDVLEAPGEVCKAPGRTVQRVTEIDAFVRYTSGLAEAFAELREYCEQHHEMRAFVPVAAELEQQAQRLMSRESLDVAKLESPGETDSRVV